MATNWNAILNNTNNLQDVLSILKKVLASLDVKADFSDLEGAIEVINGLDINVQEKLGTLAQELESFSLEKLDALNNLNTAKEEILTQVNNITTVNLIDDLNLIEKWDGRTVAVTGIGNYKYNSTSQTWERDFITDRQVVTVDSINELLNLVKWDGRTVNLKGLQGGIFKYNFDKASINDGVVCFNGWDRQLNDYTITPEMAGAIGDGFNNDTAAVQKCINFLLKSYDQSKKYKIRGSGNYALANYLLIINFSAGCDIKLRSICAHTDFPNKTDFKTATPFFQIGKNGIGGSMVGLDISCTYVNGGGKATWIDVSGYGAGGSHFHADRLENMVCGVTGVKPNFHSASNRITGGYWNTGTGIGVLIEKGDYVVEGWVVDVNFICEFNAGGIVLRDAQYADIRGQTDFNGRYVSELTLNSALTQNRDATFSNNGNTGIVIASYEESKNVFKVLVYEGRNVLENGSKFAVGAASCNGWSGSVTAIRSGGQDNWFPDVIHDFQNQPFAKCIINMPYCGGLVGSQQYSSQIQYYNSSLALTNSNNGAQVIHSSAILTLRDTRFNTNVFDATETLFAPYRHLYMKSFRVFGAEYGVTLLQTVVTNVRNLLRNNDGTATNVCEMYKVTFVSTNGGMHGEWNLMIDTSGNLYLKSIYEVNVTASVSGAYFQLAQGAQTAIFGIANFTRIF
ncbi:hypothetical protein AC057_02170 [Acinetobacter genomosp. 33YU]|uniref:hypothetical protein n=1 Tax=Acinetobacter genomosp. 33YU TaxID=1675530 RepID=UPI00097F95EE|nr:hypothetical protein [Acinetobacter genomosp. 33YU]ONN58751.1 hypothetical protein AC057_02170 [Acinetobacter genomosp. 33YU]